LHQTTISKKKRRGIRKRKKAGINKEKMAAQLSKEKKGKAVGGYSINEAGERSVISGELRGES